MYISLLKKALKVILHNIEYFSQSWNTRLQMCELLGLKSAYFFFLMQKNFALYLEFSEFIDQEVLIQLEEKYSYEEA